MACNSDLFEADPDWTTFAAKHGYLTESEPGEPSPVVLDIPSNRAQQAVSEAEWARSHPLSSVGYASLSSTIIVRDGARINVKISFPSRFATVSESSETTGKKLPILFVTHGGGWVQGTHITEEAWLLWPLYQKFDLFIVSVEYRLAPEHKFPTWMHDSWDVLHQLLSTPDAFMSRFHGTCPLASKLALDEVVLAGSSAGAGCAAYLSQTCLQQSIPIYGVILNVPVLCDYRHHPAELTQPPQNSYAQCTRAFMSSGVMKAVWDLVLPSPSAGSDPIASPLLGEVKGLPRHAIFVAGQDPLRDEGIAYARKLEAEGVHVRLFTYAGVPHTFAEFWELSATQKFWRDIIDAMMEWFA